MWYEFQSKGSNYADFKLKIADQANLIGADKKLFTFNDGQRLIGKLIETAFSDNIYSWTVEDIEGNIAIITSKQFHKITNPKNFSKKFIQFKIENHIVD